MFQKEGAQVADMEQTTPVSKPPMHKIDSSVKEASLNYSFVNVSLGGGGTPIHVFPKFLTNNQGNNAVVQPLFAHCGGTLCF